MTLPCSIRQTSLHLAQAFGCKKLQQSANGQFYKCKGNGTKKIKRWKAVLFPAPGFRQQPIFLFGIIDKQLISLQLGQGLLWLGWVKHRYLKNSAPSSVVEFLPIFLLNFFFFIIELLPEGQLVLWKTCPGSLVSFCGVLWKPNGSFSRRSFSK